MAREPKIRAKNGHWFSEAGGKGRYFGRCDQVSQAEAKARLYRALAEGTSESEGKGKGEDSIESLDKTPKPKQNAGMGGKPQAQGLSVAKLIAQYLDWLKANRSESLWREAKRHLNRFEAEFGKRNALAITGANLESFQAQCKSKGMAMEYVKKHITSIKSCFNKGLKKGWLPQGFRPFDSVDSIRLEPKSLLESELMTEQEREALFAHATGEFQGLLKCYYHTGARTHELIEAKAKDFQPYSRTLVLAKHKRSKTLKHPMPRTILLNEEAYAIVQSQCEGREPDEYIWKNNLDNAYNTIAIGAKFAKIRTKANVRRSISIYSFRHLWISEMLMAGHDSLLIARMAGTSVMMLEKVYGHFRTSSFAEAQARLDEMRCSKG